MPSLRRVCATAPALAAPLLLSAGAGAIGYGMDIPETDFKSVGLFHIEGETDDAFRYGFGTGTLLKNNLLPARSLVLTSAHNFHPTFTETGFKYYPQGPATAPIAGSWRIEHPGYNGETGLRRTDDLAVFKLASVVEGVTPSEYLREPLALNDTMTGVGFGRPQEVAGFPANIKKRKGEFKADALETGGFAVRSDSPASGNPRRPLIGRGDSGGPWFKGTDFKIAAVTQSVEDGDGVSGTQSFAVPVHPYLDFLDSFTQRAVFWDNLRVIPGGGVFASAQREGEVAQDLFDGTFTNGVASGWQRAAVANYPQGGGFVNVPANSDSRPFNALGHNTGATNEEALAGGQGLFPTGAMPFIIKKTFDPLADTAGSGWRLIVDQKFNSLELMARVGVQVGEGAITWSDQFFSTNGGAVDSWIPREMLFSTNAEGQAYTVYLATAIPAPACAPALLGVALLGRRRRA